MDGTCISTHRIRRGGWIRWGYLVVGILQEKLLEKIGEQETNNPSGKYSLDNILRMLSGRAPRFKAKIKLRKSGAEVERNISYELHHKDIPQRQEGKGVHDDSNLLEVTLWEHEVIDPFRHTGSDLIEITKGIDKWTSQ